MRYSLRQLRNRAFVKLFELSVRTPKGLFRGVWYAGDINFGRFRTPSLPIFGVILGLLLLEATKISKMVLAEPKISGMRKDTSKYARVYIDY